MIRPARISDADWIAKAIWSHWQQLKIQQTATRRHKYRSQAVLAEEIAASANQWLVYESTDPTSQGFFQLSSLAEDPFWKRKRFPNRSLIVKEFAGALKGDILLVQFQALTSYLQEDSLLIAIDATSREAYWAVLKAGFQLLGETPTVIGTLAWLYLDRHDRFEEIQLKLQRAKFVMKQE